MKKQPFRFWMTGCAAVLVASMGAQARGDTRGDDRGAGMRHSRYGLKETVLRLEASAQRRGLQVLAHVAAPRRLGDGGESLLIVFASAAGGTPVVMDRAGGTPQAPLALVVSAGRLGEAEVAVPPADWAGLPEGVEKELAALPQLVEEALGHGAV